MPAAAAQRICRAQVIRTRFYRVAGMGESDLDQLISPVYKPYRQSGHDDPGGRRATFKFTCAPAPRTEAEAEALLARGRPAD